MNKPDEILERIKNYLANGGLFNPELMEHEKVRDLLMDCRNHLIASNLDREELQAKWDKSIGVLKAIRCWAIVTKHFNVVEMADEGLQHLLDKKKEE